MPFFRSARIELTRPRGRRCAMAGRHRALQRRAESGRLPARHVSRSPVARIGQGPRPAGHAAGGRRRQLERPVHRHLLHLFPRRRAEHFGGRSALLLRRQPHPAGLRHRHGGMGRRRRLLGRPEHDPALRRPSGGRQKPKGCRQRGRQGGIGLPLLTGRHDAIRQERRDSPGARRHQRIDGALRNRHVLVWPAGRFAGANR